MTGRSILKNIPLFYGSNQPGIIIGILFMIATAYTSEIPSTEPWKLIRPSLTARALRTVTFVTPSTGWAGGRRSIFCSRDSGTTWHEQRNPCDDFVTSFFFHDTLNGWATGYNGCLLRTTDGGEHWEIQNVSATRKLTKVLFLNRAKGWIIKSGKDSNLLETTDSGRTWESHMLPWKTLTETEEYYTVNDLVFVNDSVGIVACQFSMFRTADGGTTWTPVDSVPAGINPYYKITMVNDSTGYLIGWFGIAKTIDGGLKWRMQLKTPSGGPRFECFNYTSNDTAYAFYGWNPVQLFKTVDGGSTWTYGASNIVNSIMEVSRTSRNSAIAVGENGAVYKVHGALDSMSEVTSGTGPDLTCIDFSESRYGCAGKQWSADNILLTDDGGKSWYEKPVFLDTLKPEKVTSVVRFDAQTIFVGGYTSGLIYLNIVSIDNGNSWKDVSDPNAEAPILYITKVPHSRYGAYAITYNYELLVTQDIRLGQWEKSVFPGNSLQSPLHVYNKDSVWLLTDSSVLFTKDGARIWDTLCTACVQGASYGGIFFVTPKVGWIGGITGISENRKALFYRTEDGGKTWARQENVTLLPDPAIPPPRTLTGILKIRAISTMEAWALDKSALLHTNDGGKTWTECELPQMPLSLYDMYCDTNSRWVVGDGGGIWKQGEDVSAVEPHGSQERSRPGAGILTTRVHGEYIDFELASAKPAAFRVLTITGRTVAKFTVIGKRGKNAVQLNDIPIPFGVYWYSVSVDGGKEQGVGRFVKYRR